MSIDPKNKATKLLLDKRLDRNNTKRQGYERGYELGAHRRWSAESGAKSLEKRVNLPRLKTPPEWPSQFKHDHDLKRGKLTVVPPVKTKEAFTSNRSLHKTSHKDVINSSHQFNQQQGLANIFPGVPVVYGQPVQGSAVLAPNNTIPYSYPSAVYPVPVYVSYAPVLPPIQNPMGYPMGNTGQIKRLLTRDEAATCIQKYFRGWKVRKESAIPQLQFLSQPYSAKAFIENFITEILEEELILDVLIDVLSHKKSLSPYDPMYTLSSYICSDILDEDVSSFIEIIAASVFYSQDRLVNLKRTDPLIQLCEDLTSEVVNEMALVTVQTTIKSLVHSHLTFSKSADWLEDLILETIQPMINQVAATAHASFKYEATLDEIIDEVTSEMMKPVIHEAWKEVISRHRDKQTTQIARFAEGRMLDSLFLDHLLGHLSGNNSTLYIRDYEEQTMDGLMCSVLLQQCMLVYDTNNDTATNQPIQQFHQDTFADLALDAILDELCANLDEDMLDLQEKEKSDARQHTETI